MSDRAEGTIVLLCYSLGGDRPSQTTHHTLSHTSIQKYWLEPQIHQGGISRVTPLRLAAELQRLPPILHR